MRGRNMALKRDDEREREREWNGRKEECYLSMLCIKERKRMVAVCYSCVS
jgi:hypothetical protein